GSSIRVAPRADSTGSDGAPAARGAPQRRRRRMQTSRKMCVMIFACACGHAGAQTLGPGWCVSCGDISTRNTEPAIVASPIDAGHVAVAWNSNDTSELLHYAVTLDGGAT